MNAAFLLSPLFLIRYVLLAFLNKKALIKAAHFPPMQGTEKIMYILYQLSTLAMIVYLFFLKISAEKIFLLVGLIVYILGVILLLLSVIAFASPNGDSVNKSGVYNFSRNPMYVAYFLYFLGCAVLTASIPLLLIILLFQFSAHWVILAEERWCTSHFGLAYTQYASEVNRYIGRKSHTKPNTAHNRFPT